MSRVKCIVVTTTLAGLIAGCGQLTEYPYASPRYTPGYAPVGGSDTAARYERMRNGIHPEPERRPSS
jgi:hypothetical protein